MAAGIIPVIVSGGSGTRLWPLSRPERPKQFLGLGPLEAGQRSSLFGQALLRCRGLPFDPRPVVVGGHGHRPLLAAELERAGVEAEIVLEPVARNTCAAIAAGCLQAAARAPDALVAVLAADHHIPDADAFAGGFADAAADARDGRLVTFGVRPDRTATGYGYILPGERLRRALAVERFVEKPAASQAERFIAEGWLWNSGNFLFRADTFLAELARLQPDVLDAVRAAHAGAVRDRDALLLDAASLAASPAVAVDRAVMERTGRAAVLPVAYRWRDAGSWDGLADIIGRDAAGNAVVGEAVLVEAGGNLVHAPDRPTALVGIRDTLVISTADCLLVMARANGDDATALVGRFAAEGRPQATATPPAARSWGSYERLGGGDGHAVARVTIAPGAAMPQRGRGRGATHWTMVAGKAEASAGGETRALLPGQSMRTPAGTAPRLANHGPGPAVLIEVRTFEPADTHEADA